MDAIEITLTFKGGITDASCTVRGETVSASFCEMASTGAKALTALVDRLHKAGHTGRRWRVVRGAEPGLEGVVAQTRRSRRKRPPLQHLWVDDALPRVTKCS